MRAAIRAVVLACFAAGAAGRADAQPIPPTDDLRTHYDVQYYRLDLQVLPRARQIAGIGVVQGTVLVEALPVVAIDLHRQLAVDAVHLVPLDCGKEKSIPLGDALTYRRDDGEHAMLRVTLPAPVAKGGRFAVAVRYHGAPPVQGDPQRAFTGFHFRQTEDGAPWINTSCQGIGAHTWWPCKASFFYPDDKQDRMDLNIHVPGALVAACNGRLVGVDAAPHPEGSGRVFRWHHPYPCCTYSIALNVAPYVDLKSEIKLPGLERKLPVHFFVLPRDVEKAKIQFAVVPEMLRFFGEKFGPFAFPEAKYALVQTNYWGMEHSTIVAYGSSFPDALKKLGTGRDAWAARNRWFDYILIHESAHEWWGNAVSATDWGHFWIHEGFGTYAEVLWVEHVHGPQKMHEFVAEYARNVHDGVPIYQASHATGHEAYNASRGNIYYKGACVLHQLRGVMGDEPFFRALKRFNLEFRYKNASTEDWQKTCEAESEQALGWFFKSWVYGVGRAEPTVAVEADPDGAALVTRLHSTTPENSFRWPLRVTVKRGGKPETATVWMEPGEHRQVVRDAKPGNVKVEGLEWLVLTPANKAGRPR